MLPNLGKALTAALADAPDGDRTLLPESVALAAAAAIGAAVPHRIELSGPEELSRLDLEAFTGDRLVIKALLPGVAHKTELDGVVVCDRAADDLERALRAMAARLGDRADGYSVHQWIEHDRAAGGELLLGVRWTDDFGPVAVLGLGGLEVERLTGEGALAPLLTSRSATGTEAPLLPAASPIVRFLTEPWRGRPARLERDRLEELLARLLDFAEGWMDPGRTARVTAFEINPLVPDDDEAWALDALLEISSEPLAVAVPRPLEKLERLLAPSSIAVAGVSRRLNIGRVILRNILARGFDRRRVTVIKPDCREIDGCRCRPSFADLEEGVDLAVLSVEAAALPAMMEEILAGRRAESVILIPGGLGERAGSESHAEAIASALAAARRRPDRGPVVNGGNCLGVRSLPGGYDTLFIPGHKLDLTGGRPVPLALLSQSGAFAVARASKLAGLDPRYVVTFGNQIDLTLADYLTYLEGDRDVRVFACYLEGFRALDGRRFLSSARNLAAQRRPVILYRAGRTPAGARAASSHTASVAGSYRVTRDLARRAGVLVAESIEELEDLVRIFSLLAGRSPAGRRLGALSNAGFETVGIGDNLAGLELAALATETEEAIGRLFAAAGIDAIVAPGNPLDLTPVLGDEAFVAAARRLLADPAVEVGLVGCVPLTGALQTLPAGEGHAENLAESDSVAERLIAFWAESTLPWVAVVDGGPLYDPFARRLDEAGIPTFRSVDRALGALARWTRFHLDPVPG